MERGIRGAVGVDARRRKPVPLTRRPLVSVAMPCYCYGNYLPAAVESVLSQTGVDVELIIIDDASPDGSGEVVQRLADADPRITAILHKENQGHIATFNEGLERATGEFFLLLSADDGLPAGALARAAALFDAEPSVGLVGGYTIEFDGKIPQISQKPVRSWTIWSGHTWLQARCVSPVNTIRSPEAIVRMSVQRAVGSYNPVMLHTSDYEMWLRIAAVADIGRVNGPAQAFYRVHNSSMSRTVYRGTLMDLESRLAGLESVLGGGGVEVPDAARLLATAHRGLARSALGAARLAHHCGRASQEPIAEYVAFAERVWPPIRGTLLWRAVRRQRERGGDGGTGPVAWAGRLASDLSGQARWRWWRRTGLW